MSQQVTDKAKELARVISLSPEYISMRATEDAAGQDELLKGLFAQYDEIHRQVEDATLRKEPDFDKIGELSRELETVLEQIIPMFAEITEWKDEEILSAMTKLTETMGVKKSVVMWPVRIGAAGKAVTPGGAVEICRILGKDETLRRLGVALKKLA